MDLDETLQVGLRPEKTKPLHISSEITLWVSERAQGSQRCCLEQSGIYIIDLWSPESYCHCF